MKSLNSWLLCGTIALLTATNPTSAQTPPALALRLFAAVNITDTVGGVYVVQSTSDLAMGFGVSPFLKDFSLGFRVVLACS